MVGTLVVATIALLVVSSSTASVNVPPVSIPIIYFGMILDYVVLFIDNSVSDLIPFFFNSCIIIQKEGIIL